MKVYTKTWEALLPIPIEKAWNYFSRPENLNELTPDDMKFEILSDVEGVDMYEGMLIRYNVSPLFNIKMSWVTEITKIDPLNYFIDEQRFGPFALWHHEHHFEKRGSSTFMTDVLHYAIPLGVLGQFAHRIIVDNRVDEIFNFRKEKLKILFPENKSVSLV